MIITWLPLPSFKDSVRSLSDSHLGLQRLHVLHMIEVIHEVDHEASSLPDDYQTTDSPVPAIELWEGHEMQLLEYGLEACDEWSSRRGKKDKLYDAIYKHLEWSISEESNMGMPWWFGEVDFHLSHQSALIRADKTHYSSYFMADPTRKLVWLKAASEHG